MSEHTYGHLKDDYFKNIKKKYIEIKILSKTMELRKLKIKKINENII